jgi:hypothetical protein
MFDDEIFKVMLQDLYIHPALSIYSQPDSVTTACSVLICNRRYFFGC